MGNYFIIFSISIWPIGEFEILYGEIPPNIWRLRKQRIKIWRFGFSIDWWFERLFYR